MSSLIEQIREHAVQDLLGIKAFENGWEDRKAFFEKRLGSSDSVTRQDIIQLGEALSEGFSLKGSKDRSQGGVSSAGAVWEALVVWYLNLCLAGTHAVCVRGAKHAPSPVKDSLTILHESTILRSEPDVIIFSGKGLSDLPRESSLSKAHDAMDRWCASNYSSLGVVNIQCKTNWNDNAQIPMLWNMLYNQARKGAIIPNGFSIGKAGYSLMNLGHFGYAFMTVPTQKKGPNGYKPMGMDVLRVKSMTAGNYWGHPSKNAICSCISEIYSFFTKNRHAFPNIADVAAAAAKAIESGGSDQLSVQKLLFPF